MDYLFKNFIEEILDLEKSIEKEKGYLNITDENEIFIIECMFGSLERYYEITRKMIVEKEIKLGNKVRFYKRHKEQFNSRGYYYR